MTRSSRPAIAVVVPDILPVVFAVLVAGLLACQHDSDDSAGADSIPGAPLECVATLSALTSTVVNLSWRAPSGSESWARLGGEGGYDAQTRTVTDQEVTLSLVGVPAGATLMWEGVSEVDGVRSTCAGETVVGQIPAEIPVFTVDVDDRAAQDPQGFFLGAYYNLFAPTPYFVVLNRAGEVVWYGRGEPLTLSPDIQFAVDGVTRGAPEVLYNRFSFVEGLETSVIYRIALDGTPLETIATPWAHHMFTQLPEGVIAFQQDDAREFTDPGTGVTDTWHADAIAEVPPGGSASTVFTIWDWLEPEVTPHSDELSIYGGVDWTHGNALKYQAESDSWLLSLAHVADVLTIDRASAEPVAWYGGDGVPAAPPFDYQHDPTLLDSTHLLMFMTDPETTFSGAVEYEINEAGDGLTETWRRGFEANSAYLGQATRLGNGNTFVNYSQTGTMEEVTADGTVVWRGTTGGASPTGQFRPFEGFYDP